ncbi:hypothetical protein [Sphingobacterium puteale]|uniref:hypothetical protein n=1 Tax=Sphingobacterium puteale TaxID=2420510 RepID=UPI003D966F4E
MEIKRIKILCVSIGLLILISCKLYEHKKRDKREEVEIDWQHTELRQRLYTFRQDTLSRRWYFWTDSAFRFHPDSGLLAQSGILLGQESKRNIDKQMQDLTTKNKQGKQKEVKHDQSINRMISVKYFWFVGFAVVLLVLWKWSRSRLLV